jgi:hypothetical protein
MRYETQADILRSLNQVCRHYAAAALSLTVTRSFDGARILTMAAMTAVGDAVLRVAAVDHPSQLSLHYSGAALGPLQPFGIETGMLALESDFLEFTSPELCIVRTQVLDYFTQMQQVVPRDHVVFQFESSMQFGAAERDLLNQVCLQMAYPRSSELLPRYLSGEEAIFLDDYPELAFFRDLVFLFKALQAPTGDTLPEVRPWDAKDVVLRWSFDSKAKDGAAAAATPDVPNMPLPLARGQFAVHGFRRKLECTAYVKPGEVEEHTQRKGLAALFHFRLFAKTETPRCPPSGANPSILAGQRIDTEDDVLHIHTLPDFEGTLRAQDAEVLLQYLTVPYMRVPLVLNFFATAERIWALGKGSVQAVVDACLFEPGPWQEKRRGQERCPEMVPAETREHLTTPCGLLFNELQHSPAGVLRPLSKMMELVLEFDTGRHTQSTSNLIMYVIFARGREGRKGMI